MQIETFLNETMTVIIAAVEQEFGITDNRAWDEYADYAPEDRADAERQYVEGERDSIVDQLTPDQREQFSDNMLYAALAKNALNMAQERMDDYAAERARLNVPHGEPVSDMADSTGEMHDAYMDAMAFAYDMVLFTKSANAAA